VNLATILFWKKKDSSNPESERIIPLPHLLGPPRNIVQSSSIPSEEDISKARNALKVLQLERQIIGSALTTIFESETKGIISPAERVRLVDKYKVDLEQLEKSIEQHQCIVERYDLENSRQEIVRGFNLKMSEIDEKIRRLNNGNLTPLPQDNELSSAEPSDRVDPPVSDAEKRVEQIRDEILKAMDRLEQIESEG
jgi:hypothetical protein